MDLLTDLKDMIRKNCGVPFKSIISYRGTPLNLHVRIHLLACGSGGNCLKFEKTVVWNDYLSLMSLSLRRSNERYYYMMGIVGSSILRASPKLGCKHQNISVSVAPMTINIIFFSMPFLQLYWKAAKRNKMKERHKGKEMNFEITFMLNPMPWALHIFRNTLWYNMERLEWHKRLPRTA